MSTDAYSELQAVVAELQDAKGSAFGILTADENSDVPVTGYPAQPSLAKRFKQAFDVVADATTRADLANSTDPAKGAGLVGRGVVAVDSIADLLLQPQEEDKQFEVRSYNGGQEQGGGSLYWDATSEEDEDLINIFQAPAIHTGRWKRRKKTVDIADAGAVPGAAGASATTEAFLRAAAEGQNITYPYHPDGWHVEDTIQLVNTQEIHGPGKNYPGIIADMALPIVRFGNDSNITDRRNALRGVFLKNTGGDALYIKNSPDWSVVHSRLESSGGRAVYAELSVRPYMADCRLNSSGAGSWCMQLVDNVNAGVFAGIQASGGSSGGVADVSRSYALHFDSWVMESTKLGLQFGANPDALLGGSCNAIRLSNMQWEQCEAPLSVGAQYSVQGFTMDGGYISNSSTSVIPNRDWAILLGRLKGGYIKGLVVDLHPTEYLFNLYRLSTAAATQSMEDFSISNLCVTNIGAGLYKTSGQFSGTPTTLNFIPRERNVIDVEGYEVIGNRKSIIAGPIQTASNISETELVTTGGFGGIIESIEIIEATGTLSGTLRIGNSANIAEHASVDLSALSPVRGKSTVPISVAALRTSSRLSFSTTGTTATSGTFKLKINYR